MSGVPEPLLTASDLHKRFGVTEALRGVDLAVAPGEMVAVTGPSGSGKSTHSCIARPGSSFPIKGMSSSTDGASTG